MPVHLKFKSDSELSHHSHSEKHLRQAILGYGVIDEVVSGSAELFDDAAAVHTFREMWLDRWRAMGCVDSHVSEAGSAADVEEGEEESFSNAETHTSITSHSLGRGGRNRREKRRSGLSDYDDDDDDDDDNEKEEWNNMDEKDDAMVGSQLSSSEVSAKRQAIVRLRRQCPFLANLNGKAVTSEASSEGTPSTVELCATVASDPAPTMIQPVIKLLGKKHRPAPIPTDVKSADLLEIAAKPAAQATKGPVRKSTPSGPSLVESIVGINSSSASHDNTFESHSSSLRAVIAQELYAKYLGFPFQGLLLLYLPNSCAPYPHNTAPPPLEPYTYRTGRVSALHYNDVDADLYQLESVTIRDTKDGRECIIPWPPGTVSLPSDDSTVEGTASRGMQKVVAGDKSQLPVLKHRDVTFQEFMMLYRDAFSSNPLSEYSESKDSDYVNTGGATRNCSNGDTNQPHSPFISLTGKGRSPGKSDGKHTETEKNHKKGIGSSDLFIHDHLQAALSTFSSKLKRKDKTQKKKKAAEERSGRDSASSAVMALLDSSDEDDSYESGDDVQGGGSGDDDSNKDSDTTSREAERTKRGHASTQSRLQQLLWECTAAGGEIEATYMAEYVDRHARNISIRWIAAFGTLYSKRLHSYLNESDKGIDLGHRNDTLSARRGHTELSIGRNGSNDGDVSDDMETQNLVRDTRLIKDLMTLSRFEMGLLQRRLVEAEYHFQYLFPLPVAERQGLDHTSVYREPPHPMSEYTLDPQKPGPPSSALQLHRKYMTSSNTYDDHDVEADDLYGDTHPGRSLPSTRDVHNSMKAMSERYKKPRLRMVRHLGDNCIQPLYDKVHADTGRYTDRYLLESERLDNERNKKRSNERRSFMESALQSKGKRAKLRGRKEMDVMAQALRLIEMGDGDLLDMDIDGEGGTGSDGDGDSGGGGGGDNDGDDDAIASSLGAMEESHYQALLARERGDLLRTPLLPEEEPLPHPSEGDNGLGSDVGGPEVTIIGVAQKMKMKMTHSYNIHLTDVVLYDHRRNSSGTGDGKVTEGGDNDSDGASNGELPAMVVPTMTLKLNPTHWHL